MSDDYEDLLLRSALGDLRQHTLDQVHPIGATATLAVARRRNRRRVAATAIAVAVALAVPVAVYAAIRGPGRTPLPPATGGPTSPPSSATPPPSSTTETPASDGPGDLANATLTLDWSFVPGGGASACPNGPTKFTDGETAAGAGGVVIVATGHVDVDHNGSADVVAFLRCAISEVGAQQVVAFAPNGAGAFATIGTVARADYHDGHDGVSIRSFGAFATRSDGVVLLTVRDRAVCCGVPAASAVTQIRGYAWNGAAFMQTTGPTAFIGDKSTANLSMTIAPITLGPADATQLRSGTLTVTVHNAGPQPVADVLLRINVATLTASGGDWARCPDQVCALHTLAAGDSVTVRLPVQVSVGPDDTAVGSASLRAGEYWYQESTVPIAK